MNERTYENWSQSAKFSINIIFSEDKNYNKNGLDKVEFLISTNIGEESKPLIKIASGEPSGKRYSL